MPESILPIIHRNGDQKETLVQQYADCVNALEVAGRSLASMAPNARNFYPVEGLMQKAEALHRRRRETLDQLIGEIRAEMLAIARLG